MTRASNARGARDPARPPLGGWGRAYALVIGALLLEIVLMWLLTERHR